MKNGQKGYTVSVLGGDMRSLYAARYLAKKGCTCRLFCLGEQENPCSVGFERGKCQAPYRLEDAFFEADFLLLPLPLTRDGVHINAPLCTSPPTMFPLLEQIPTDLPIMGGGLDLKILEGRRAPAFDLLKDEAFLAENALPSAEGAIGLALMHHKGILSGSNCAVLGYGRIAQALLPRLLALGGRVTVFARKREALTSAQALGAEALPFSALEKTLPGFDLLFNTVPARIFQKEHCKFFARDALYLELASPPFGMDEECVLALSKRHLYALGLPGKYAPLYAGNLIGRRVFQVLSEKNGKI